MERRKVIVSILALVVLMFSTTNVFAAINWNETEDDDTFNIVVEDENNNNNRNVNNNNQAGGNLVQKDEINQNVEIKNENKTIPNTGIEDLPIIAIVICIVSAVIAYTQIRRYNV